MCFCPFTYSQVNTLTREPHVTFSSTRSPPTSKRLKTSPTTSASSQLIAQQPIQPFQPVSPFEGIPMPQPPITPTTSRKRRSSPQSGVATAMAAQTPTTHAEADKGPASSPPEPTPKKKGRTNTPWTAEEEQRLKTMRDAGCSWNEIAKVRMKLTLLSRFAHR